MERGIAETKAVSAQVPPHLRVSDPAPDDATSLPPPPDTPRQLNKQPEQKLVDQSEN